jgi:hypothetical protein
MEESTSAMMIRDVPIGLRMQLKALAAMQRRRLRDVAIEALREKIEKHRRGCTNEVSLSEHSESCLKTRKAPASLAG